MKKNKGSIFVVLISIVILGLVGILCFLVYDNAQYNIVATEVSNMNINNTVDMEIKSKGKYKGLEKAIKEYANEYYTTVNELKGIYSKDVLKMSLSIDNIKNDGPNFDNTKKTISEFIVKQNEIKTKIQELISEEYLNKIIEENLLDQKNRELFLATINLKEDANEICKAIDSYINYANSTDQVLSFLGQNQKNWSVKDNKIMFNNSDLLAKYNSLIDNQKNAQSGLKTKLSKGV